MTHKNTSQSVDSAEQNEKEKPRNDLKRKNFLLFDNIQEYSRLEKLHSYVENF